MKIKFLDFINEEAAPRIPKNISYWMNRQKSKDVCIYTHDDLDGIASGIAIRNYLIEQGFNIVKYGIVNYQEGWDVIHIDPELVNVAVDFAEFHPDISVYIDHHGDAFGPDNISYASKTSTESAYEGIMDQIGKPVDKLTLDVINMIDSALYTERGVSWEDLLNFDLSEIKNKPNAKMLFAGAFNQMLKRSDYKTFIEVIYNAKDVSIFEIFNLFKKFFPKNNPEFQGRGKNKIKIGEKEFVDDASKRLTTMKQRTEGNRYQKKEVFKTNKRFLDAWLNPMVNKIQMNGYQIIGNLAFFPSGTWANAIRARAILDKHFREGIIPKGTKITFILLQYGSTLQIIFYEKPKNESEYPILRNGKKLDNIGDYTDGLLDNFRVNLGYIDPEEQKNWELKPTTAGGREGIGSISNIMGKCREGKWSGMKFLDLFKNKIIRDLSGLNWDVSMSWGDPEERPITREQRQREYDKRVMNVKRLRKVDNKGNIISAEEPTEEDTEWD